MRLEAMLDLIDDDDRRNDGRLPPPQSRNQQPLRSKSIGTRVATFGRPSFASRSSGPPPALNCAGVIDFRLWDFSSMHQID